jgi:hypothetical protein
MTTPDRLLAKRRPRNFRDEIEPGPSTAIEPTPGLDGLQRLSIAFEYAAARRWKRAHPEYSAAHTRPSVGVMTVPAEPKAEPGEPGAARRRHSRIV